MDQDKKLPKTKRVFRKKFIKNKIENLKVIHLGCCGGLLDESSIKNFKKNFIKEDDTHYQFSKYAKEISGLDISQNKIEFYFAENEQIKSNSFINFIVGRFGRIFSFIFNQFSQDLALIAKTKE